MLRFITGGAGTGKSTRMEEEMRGKAAEGKTVFCLVPEQYSFETERKLYANEIQVYSMERLAEAVFRQCGGLAGEYADETVQLLLMRETLRDCRAALSLYGKNAARPDFAAEMLAAVQELRRAGLSPEKLEETAALLTPSASEETPGALAMKLRDLSLILAGYDAALSRSFLDPSKRLERAAKLIAENGFFAGAEVFVDEYNSFTGVQLQILSLAIAQAENVTVALCIDPEREDTGLFDGVRETERALKSAAAKANVPVAPPVMLSTPHRYKNMGIAHFGGQLLKAAPVPMEGVPEGIEAVQLDHEYEEAAYAAAKICSLVKDNGYAYEDIAVLSRDMGSRAPSIEAAFDRYGIPYFLDSGRTVEAMPLTRFILHLCQLVLHPLDREEALMLLKCGVLELEPEDIAAFEEYTYVWDLTGFSLRKAFARNPSGFSDREMGERELDKLKRAEDTRQLLVKLYDDFRALADELGISRGIYRLLCDYQVDAQLQAQCDALLDTGEELDAENLRLSWDSLMNFLDAAETLRRVRDENGEQMDMAEFRELLQVCAAGTKLVTRPQTLDSVLVGDLSQVRTGEKRCVLILGCNEGIFPRLPESAGLLTGAERQQLALLGLPVQGLPEQKLWDERFVAYKAIMTPSERLILIWSAGDLSGAVQPPSELIDSLRAVFPELPVLSQREISPLFFSQSRSTAFLQAARLPDGAEREMLETVLEESSEWKARLNKLNHTAAAEQRQIYDQSLSHALFAPLGQRGGKTFMEVSPSQVEKYFSCPFAYFCRYGLGVRSLQKAELSPLARGSIIHFLLEKIMQRPDFVKLNEDELQKMTLSLLAEYLDQVLGGKEEKSAKFLYYFYRLREAVGSILAALQREFQATSFQVCGLEEVIREGARIEPFTVSDDTLTISVSGKVDRIDTAQAEGEQLVRVIDYKTGGKEFKLDEAEKGLNLQMLLYLFAIWQGSESGRAFAGATPAGILYMPAKALTPTFDRHEGGEEAKEKLYRMNGLVLDEERVLRAMEGGQPGAFIEKPSSRSPQNSRITREGLSHLREEVEGLLTEMGRDLLAGHIQPEPKGYGNRLPCGWCEYKTLCGRA